MQEQRSRTAIRSWYRAQRVAARRDRNVEGTSSQCALGCIFYNAIVYSCAFMHLYFFLRCNLDVMHCTRVSNNMYLLYIYVQNIISDERNFYDSGS